MEEAEAEAAAQIAVAARKVTGIEGSTYKVRGSRYLSPTHCGLIAFTLSSLFSALTYPLPIIPNTTFLWMMLDGHPFLSTPVYSLYWLLHWMGTPIERLEPAP